jgi:2-C-methyl-D-erythritol 4-phosphate cytidylyltransferase
MTVGFILVAAGSGARLGEKVPKAFVEVAGRSLLARSFEALQAEPRFSHAVVVAPAGWCGEAARQLQGARPPSLALAVVEGGEERQHSVRLGLDALSEACTIVVVHDAARPFVPPEQVRACIDLAAEHGAATLAVAATDTVKEVDEQGRVRRTFDRSRLRLVQTPQAFRRQILRDAHDRALRQGSTATDDATLVEEGGGVVWTVPGVAGNLKITTPDDLAWARWRLGAEHR